MRNSSSQKRKFNITHKLNLAQEFELVVLLKNNDEKNTGQKLKLKALSQKKRVKQTDYDETNAECIRLTISSPGRKLKPRDCHVSQ